MINAFVAIMTLMISLFFLYVLFFYIVGHNLVPVDGFLVPISKDIATQVAGPLKLYSLLDVLSNIPPPGSLQATGYQVTNFPPVPYSDKPYIVTPPSAIITPQTYFVPTPPSFIAYPNVSGYTIGPVTDSYNNPSTDNRYDNQNTVTGSLYGSGTSGNPYKKPYINPELIHTGPNPPYPPYPGSSYSEVLKYNVGNVYNANPVKPDYTAVTSPLVPTYPITHSPITFIPAPGAVLTNADCSHYKCQNEKYNNMIGNGGKYTPAVLPGLASTFVGSTDDYLNDNHGQPPPIPFPPNPPPVQFGSDLYNPPLNVGLNAGISSGSFGLGFVAPGPTFGSPFIGGGFNGGITGSFEPGFGFTAPRPISSPVGITNGVGAVSGYGNEKPYQGGGTFPLITPDYPGSTYSNTQYSSNQAYSTDSYGKGGVGVAVASGTPYNIDNGAVAVAYNGYGGSYHNTGSSYDQSSNYNPPLQLPNRPFLPPPNSGYPAAVSQLGVIGSGLDNEQYGTNGFQPVGNQVDIRGLGVALASLTHGDGLSSQYAQQFPIVSNGLLNSNLQGGPSETQFQPISESDAVLALALNAILEDRHRPRQRTTGQLVADVLRSRSARVSPFQNHTQRESNSDLWRQFLTGAVAFVSKRLNENV